MSSAVLAWRGAAPEVRESATHLHVISWTGLMVFLIGVVCPLKVEFVGSVLIGELALALVAFWSLVVNLSNRRYWEPAFVVLLMALLATFSGYVLSDLINGTAFENLSRGWARVLFLITNFVGLNYLCRKYPGRIVPFLVGLAIGYSFSGDHPSMSLAYYKVAIGIPIAIALLSLLSLVETRGRYLLTGTVISIFGFINLFLDYRSLGLFTSICGVIILTKSLPSLRFRSIYTIIFAFASVVSAAGFTYAYLASQEQYGDRRSDSNLMRIATARAAIFGISESPIFGNGSWSATSELAGIVQGTYAEASGKKLIWDGVPGHSQVLQVWHEAGLLGLTFFVTFFFFLVDSIRTGIFRARLTPLFPLSIFFFVYTLWDLFMSPFAGVTRLFIAIALTLVLMQRRTHPFTRLS